MPELHSTMYRGDVCIDCIPADARDSDEPEPVPGPNPHTTSGQCGSCGRMCPPYERDADGWCRGCVDAARDVQNGHGASPCARCGSPVGHQGVGAGSTPDRIVCHSCAGAEQKERRPNCFLCARPTPVALLDTDGLCPTCGNWERSGVGGACDDQCSNSQIDPAQAKHAGLCWSCGGRRELITDFGGTHRHVPCHECFGTGKADADNAHEPPGEPPVIYAQAERLGTEETEPKETVMNALPSASIGTTGEGYTDTVQSLQALAKEMQDAQNAATDLGDSLTANSLDPDTLQQIGDLVDQVESCSTLAENLRRHVEQRHNPMAEATAAAGGSQNVATKTWYDQY